MARRIPFILLPLVLAGVAACDPAPAPTAAPSTVTTLGPTAAPSPSPAPSASRSSSPPRRTSPARPSGCLTVTTYVIDGADTADTPRSLCLRIGATLRVENIGPGELSAEPAGIANCHYEAGVVECRFTTSGTVTIRLSPTRAFPERVVA